MLKLMGKKIFNLYPNFFVYLNLCMCCKNGYELLDLTSLYTDGCLHDDFLFV